MKKVQLNPVFVKTKNVRNFEVMMDALALADGEECFGMVYSRAGRGKTRTSQWYSAHHDCVYLRILTIWRSGELDFLKSFCKALNILSPPGRKGPAFAAIVDNLIKNPRPVFLDEIEKMPQVFLKVVQDITDCARIPIILIGEEELVSYMKQNRRVWSRTFQQMEFKPIEIADIIMYGGESAGLKLSIPVAQMMHKASGGDFRLVKRDLLGMAQAANANQTTTITEKMAKIVIKSGLSGR
jgi:DNA transposition AAA+ family ATPase